MSKFTSICSSRSTDELGYLDIGGQGSDLMFQLVSTRYDQRSSIITTNVGIGGWAKVFGDEVTIGAIADKVCHGDAPDPYAAAMAYSGKPWCPGHCARYVALTLHALFWNED